MAEGSRSMVPIFFWDRGHTPLELCYSRYFGPLCISRFIIFSWRKSCIELAMQYIVYATVLLSYPVAYNKS